MVNLIKKLRSGERYIILAAMAFVIGASVILTSFFIAQDAQALRISMKRIVFEGSKRSDIVTIINNTAKEKTYRLGFRHYRMDVNRSLVRLEGQNDPQAQGIMWADKMIRYAPRRVTVPAGASQQIRLLLRRPRDLAEGEYRSHLWIVTESETDEFDANASPSGQQSFRLAMNPAITIPVFVRHGDMTASATVSNIQVSASTAGKNRIKFAINREGNRSLYGDMRVVCTGGAGEYVASHTRGIAVYTEVSQRFFDFEYDVPADKASQCRSVRVEYIADREDRLFNGKLMAQGTASY